MRALIAMALALGLLVALLYRRVRVGRAMFWSAIALAVLLKVTPRDMIQSLVSEFRDASVGLTQTTPYLFISLTVLLLGVNVLGAIIQHTGVSQRLIVAMYGLFRSRRAAIAGLPLLMGMLPTPGGIMLSAPMVRDLGDSIGIERSRQAAINFYFRHQWEPVWPLFPAIPLVQGILGVSAFSVISHNLIISIVGIGAGIVFLLLGGMPPKAENPPPARRRLQHNLQDLAHAFWPIALTALLYAALNVPPAGGIIVSILGLLLLHRVPRRHWRNLFKAANEPDMVLLVFSALFFKLNLQAAGAVGEVVVYFNHINMPPQLIVFLLPFIVGFLSGVTMPTVAMTFPFLAAFIGTGPDAKMPLETLAFSGLLCGLLLTPVHLCLPLSAGYFQTPLPKIIARLLVPSFLTVLIVATAVYLLMR
ncbi:MAG: DUF401 family protein [Phycisphaerae bacterium]|nr:DUF401 family protein [Phycisphaerae bacterium]